MSDTEINLVVYGAPGTGKTTLITAIKALDDKALPYCFTTIEEPTHNAEIVELLKQMYNETPEFSASGHSLAAKTQLCILEARFETYRAHVARIDALRAEAQSRSKRLVVVFDGHVTTDMMIYVRSKMAAGQINPLQYCTHTHKIARLEKQLGYRITPDVLCQLCISDDEFGIEHHRRVCLLRQTEAERDVPPSVFANLAAYANAAHASMKRNNPMMTTARIDTKTVGPDTICDNILAILDVHCVATS